MAELADALDSGSSARKGVEVQVLSSALVNNGVSRHRGKPRFLLGTPEGTPEGQKTCIVDAVKKTPRTVIGVTERG